MTISSCFLRKIFKLIQNIYIFFQFCLLTTYPFIMTFNIIQTGAGSAFVRQTYLIVTIVSTQIHTYIYIHNVVILQLTKETDLQQTIGVLDSRTSTSTNNKASQVEHTSNQINVYQVEVDLCPFPCHVTEGLGTQTQDRERTESANHGHKSQELFSS